MRLTSHAIFFILLSATLASAGSRSDYQKGTITKQSDGIAGTAAYLIDGGSTKFAIERCSKFRSGQVVEFRTEGDQAYIRGENGGESKCNILSTYLKGTILGYAIRRDESVSGVGSSVSSSTRHAKVYELRGSDLIYQIDYCGAFQAGKFSAGQEVEFRVDEKEGRLYILHDVAKEYSCQLEGSHLPDGGARSAAASGTPASEAAPKSR